LLDLVSEWLWLSGWDGNVIADPGNGSRVVDNLRSHVVSPSPDGVLGCLCRCIVSGVYMTWLKLAWPDTVLYYAASWGGGFRPVEWGASDSTSNQPPWTAHSPRLPESGMNKISTAVLVVSTPCLCPKANHASYTQHRSVPPTHRPKKTP
jgi:hypothetical protein